MREARSVGSSRCSSRWAAGALAYRLRIALRSVSFGPRCTARRGLGGGRRSARRGGPRVAFAAGPGGRPLMTCSARRLPGFAALFSALSVGTYRSAPGADSPGGSLRPPRRGELPEGSCASGARAVNALRGVAARRLRDGLPLGDCFRVFSMLLLGACVNACLSAPGRALRMQDRVRSRSWCGCDGRTRCGCQDVEISGSG